MIKLVFELQLKGKIFVPEERKAVFEFHAAAFVVRAINLVYNRIHITSPRATGKYLKGFTKKVFRGGGGEIFGVIHNELPWSDSVEEGWYHGKWIPPGKLIPWMKARHIIAKKVGRPSNKEKTSMRRLEFLIARSIRDKGIAPKYIMAKAFTYCLPALRRYEEETAKAIAREL